MKDIAIFGNLQSILLKPKGNNEIIISHIKMNQSNCEYKYIGIYFNRRGSFAKNKTHIAKQATRSMYSPIRNSNRLNLPNDLKFGDTVILTLLNAYSSNFETYP
jgi:hypothetical protein